MTKINARQAAQSAASYLNEIRDLIDAKLKDIRLEEIELLEDQKNWIVTLGYDVPYEPSPLSVFQFMNPPETAYTRNYKIFEVNSETGDVQSMKIRSVS
jgi:hypothetical protein